MRRCILLIALSALAIPYLNAEAATPAKPDPAAKPADVAAPPKAPDPTAAVIAEGQFLYRQRDLDALMMIASRHAKLPRFTPQDESQVRQALIQALTARESLLAALAKLPPVMAGKPRDALTLDLLDLQAEPAPAAIPVSAPLTPGDPTQQTSNPAAPAANGTTAPVADDTGPLLVRLPPLTRAKTIANVGKRQLTVGLALYFQDRELAKKMEPKAPLIQDAVLAYVEKLTGTDFAEPTQAALKEGLTKAILVKVPEFPLDGLLIPQLEVTNVDAAGK